MDFDKAKKILDLDSTFTAEQVKQNYHRLSLKHHPDKGGDKNDFIDITQAYEYITSSSKNETESKQQTEKNVINLNDIFRTFISPNLHRVFAKQTNTFFGFKKEITINITPKEFLEGVTKEIDQYYKINCGCEPLFCHRCRGFSFMTCEECSGSGIIYCGTCTSGFITKYRKVNIDIPKESLQTIVLENTIVNLELTDKNYFVHDTKLYYNYNVTLKESLTGFKKTFKDPFDFEHTVISNGIIKKNDGYSIPNGIVLLFNIIYPKKLSKSVLKQLKQLDF